MPPKKLSEKRSLVTSGNTSDVSTPLKRQCIKLSNIYSSYYPKDAQRIAFYYLVREVHKQNLTLADLESKPKFLYTALNKNIPEDLRYVPEPSDGCNPNKERLFTQYTPPLERRNRSSRQLQQD